MSQNWTNLSSGMDSKVNVLTCDGTNLYVGGTFKTAGGVAASRVAMWNGTSWTNLGSGMESEVLALACDGTNLYAGGMFMTAGGVAANRVAMWNGTSWTNLGIGMNSKVNVLTCDGTNLYAGGAFIGVAMWNGTSWMNLGSGMNHYTYALLHDGTNLYAGGQFTTAGGVAANRVAMWNGTSWINLGDGVNGIVNALACDGTNLYAGGLFTTAGGVAASRVAMWNGTSWTNLGDGMDSKVNVLTCDGTKLYAGGWFTTAGGVSVNRIAKWAAIEWAAIEMNVLGTNGAVIFSGEHATADNGTDFGSLGIGSALTNTFAITNAGMAALTISGVTTSGAGASVFSVSSVPGQVAMGGVTNFSVRFAPTNANVYTAQVSFANNSTSTPYLVNLAGTGDVGPDPDTGTVIIQVTPENGTWVLINHVSQISGTGNLDLTNMPAGTYKIQYKPLIEYVPPPEQTQILTPASVAVFEGVYLQVSTNIPAPRGVSATEGTYTNKIRVSWQSVAGAIGYEVWRSQTNDPETAGRIADNITAYYYDDDDVVPINAYYYWVRAKTETQISPMSYVGMGYATVDPAQAQVTADIAVSDLVFLPVNITNLSHAGTVSCRLANNGPDTLNATRVEFNFYMGSNDAAMAWIGSDQTNMTLNAGEESLVILTPVGRRGLTVRGDLIGIQRVKVTVRHLSAVNDPNLANNTTTAAGTVLVKASGVNSPSRSLNDYDGDGKSDLALWHAGSKLWVLRPSGPRYQSIINQYCDAGDCPVPGDYDGDGVTDMAIWCRLNGWWNVLFSSTKQVGSTYFFGGLELTAAQSDFDGDSKTDPVAYREADGYWQGAASSRQYALCSTFLGETGYQPVMADYDGDGLADPAVYNRESGLWGIALSSVGYQPLVTGTFGGSGYLPASADYDGDGLADPAVYEAASGKWQVLLSGNGYALAQILLQPSAYSLFQPTMTVMAWRTQPYIIKTRAGGNYFYRPMVTRN